MARPKRTLPKSTLHKASGLARVYIHGRYIYLGKWGSPEANEKLRKILLELETVPQSMRKVTVNDLIARFLVWAEKHYRHPNGEHTGSFQGYRTAVKHLVTLHGETLVSKFGPLALKAVREKMVDVGWCRTKINDRVGLIRTVFKWGVENELVPETIYRALLAVRGLEQGKTTAPDYPPVTSAPLEDVLKTIQCCHKTLADMIRLQLLCGMRPQEVRLIRSCDIDKRDSNFWVYIPHRHKTQHKKNIEPS
ncbi:MAG: hypothetical protein FWH27_13760 [Planctomycetaceae bacterium]|nr:hypothetical protein [Planctomycetaceae bacterium]